MAMMAMLSNTDGHDFDDDDANAIDGHDFDDDDDEGDDVEDDDDAVSGCAGEN